MYIQFDKNKLHVQVLCGTLEEYKPTEKTKEIQSKVDKLKEKLEKFQKEEVFPELEEIQQMVEEENKKQQESSSK